MTKQSAVIAYIGLGSNLSNPQSQVETAIKEIEQLPATTVLQQSPWYCSEPLLKNDQQDNFINGAIKISTNLSPEELLDHLQQIENQHQRQRIKRWGSRTLDLDILLYGQLAINNERLTIPHAEIANRNFVLLPLFDLETELNLPDGTPLKKLLENCPMQGIVPLNEGGISG